MGRKAKAVKDEIVDERQLPLPMEPLPEAVEVKTVEVKTVEAVKVVQRAQKTASAPLKPEQAIVPATPTQTLQTPAQPALHHVSGSKTDLLLKCTYWGSPNVRLPQEPDDIQSRPDPLRYGSAFHKCMELWLKSLAVDIESISKEYFIDPVRLRSTFDRAKSTVKEIFKERGWTKRQRMIEQKLAYDPFTNKTRFLKSHGERNYSGRKPTEIPMTLDLALMPDQAHPPLIWDWKTGVSQYHASDNGQLKTMAAALLPFWKDAETIQVGIVRIDDEFMEVTEADLTVEQINRHRAVLRARMRNVLSPNPSMSPGSHCRYCPALEVCPAQREPLLVVDEASDAIDPGQVAALYVKLSNYEQQLQKVRERIKRYVEMNGPLELDNGKTLRITSYEEENLSKASINRALGKGDGGMLIQKLRDMGVVEKSTVSKLMPYNTK